MRGFWEREKVYNDLIEQIKESFNPSPEK